MSINIGHLYKKRTVRNLSGQIVDMIDETDGSGVIIRKGQVVNQAKVDELARIEEDKRKAATAFTAEVSAPQAVAEQRVIQPSKLEELEKRINGQDAKLDAILEALKK